MKEETFHGPFGARSTIITCSHFTATVSTAKSGLFKGLETLIIDGRGLHGRPCAKLSYSNILKNKERRQFHELIAEELDQMGMNELELDNAIQGIIDIMKGRSILEDAINIA